MKQVLFDDRETIPIRCSVRDFVEFLLRSGDLDNRSARRDPDTMKEGAEMHRRIGESRKETFRKERVRVNWGFKQKTNLRVVQCPREKISLRNGLRKRGYEIARASNEATVTNETRRSIRMEARAMKMGIKFNFNQIAI